MSRQSRVLITAIALGVGVLLASGPAAAGKKRIAVLEIEGARSDRLHDEVAKIVKAKHSVLSPKTFAKATRKTKTGKLNTAGVKKVARYLELDGVVEGMLVAEKDGYVLRLRLRAGATGKTVRKFAVFLDSPKMSAKIRKQLGKRLHAAIADLDPVAAPEPEPEPSVDDFDDEEPPRARERRSKRSKRKAKRKKKRSRARDLIGDRDIEAARGNKDDDDFDDESDDFEDDADDDEGGDDFDDEGDDFDDDRDDRDDDFDDDRDRDDRRSKRGSATTNARTLGISVAAGVSVVGRSLSFTARADLAQQPAKYDGAFAPGAYLTGDFYPMALAGKPDSVAASIGFGFVVERAIGLSSQIADPADMTPIDLATQRQRYGFRAQYRHNFGTKPTHPSIVLSAGYNKMTFTIDRTNVPDGVVIDVPDVEYTYIDPGLTLRLPAGEKLAFVAEGRFLAITDAGPIVTPEQYGQATVTGFDGDFAAEFQPASKWVLRAGAHATLIGYTFQPGAGEMSSNRDGDLASLDVGGALDRYIGGYLTAGYIY